MSDQPRARRKIRWVEPAPVDPPDGLLEIAGGNRLVAAALLRRGIDHPAAARAFFTPTAYRQAPPEDLPDLPAAVERLERALRSGERIAVWGDFDVDGQTSTTILVETLRGLGGDVTFHIPVRENESHGVNIPALRPLLADGVSLVLTCDTGISAHEAVDFARQQGVDFVITDHHSLPSELPDACAVVNPQRLPEGHPLRTLPGAGTAYKLAEALAGRAGRPELAARQLDLAALGTVADLATLTGDARCLVQLGLERLSMPARLGLKVLYENAELEATRLTEEHIGFSIGPRLNAIGRLGDANCVVDFLTGEDLGQARTVANRLEGFNEKRKLMCAEVFAAAQKQIEREPALLDLPVLLLAHPQWPAGVVGIVASRLVELYHRPALLLSAPPGQPARGSARSVDGINIIQAISACRDLLLGYGGHPMAAGLSVETRSIPALRQALARAVRQQADVEALSFDLTIDSWIPFEQAGLELVEQIERLAPFGPGNPAPTLATSNVVLKDHRLIGKEKEHLRLLVEDEAGALQEVLWWQGEESLLPESRFDLAYRLRASNYRGQRRVQLELVDLRVVERQILELEAAQIRVIDLRGEPDPFVSLQETLTQASTQIWAEGEYPPALPGYDRTQLEPANTLVIYTIPPERAALRQALQTVGPKQVVLCAGLPGAEQVAPFLKRLAGLARYAIQQQSGQVTLVRLAAATGQCARCVSTGVDWLAARGILSILERSGDHLLIGPGQGANRDALPQLERELNFLLQETAAYRAYYLQADAQTLVNEKLGEIP